MRLGIIGLGAVATSIVELLRYREGAFELSAMTTRKAHADSLGLVPCDDLDALLARAPELVIEAASTEALRDLGPPILTRGIDVLALSVAALATPSTEQLLRQAAASGIGRVRIPSGAGGGLDAIRAANVGGIDSVTHTVRKPPAALPGVPSGIAAAQVLFRGTARETALRFPRNANLSVAIAFAGIGLDRTEVEIVADPALTANSHHIECRGSFGSMTVRIEAKPEPNNAASSRLTAMSAVAAIVHDRDAIVVG